MTTSDERYRALKAGKKLLEELCDPGKTPRVPGSVREKARAALRHFPNDIDIDRLAGASPDIIDRQPINPLTRKKEIYGQSL